MHKVKRASSSRPPRIRQNRRQLSLDSGHKSDNKDGKLGWSIFRFFGSSGLHGGPILSRLGAGFMKVRFRLKSPFNHLFKPALVIFLIVAVVVSFSNAPSAIGATYTFVQNDWSGGTSATVAVHPTNQTGWDKYSSATNAGASGNTTNIFADSGVPTLSVAGGSATATASAIGGGFANGTNSNTTVTSGVASTFVELNRDTNVAPSWTTLATIPLAADHGAKLLQYQNDDAIYVIRGNNTNNFYKYTISTNTWTALNTLLYNASAVSEAIITNDGIYWAPGAYWNQSFYKYTISTGTWTQKTSMSTCSTGTYGWNMIWDHGDYIYLASSTYTSNGLCRYSISGNSWTVPDANVAMGVMMWDGGDVIYGRKHSNATTLSKFNISSGKVSSLPSSPIALNPQEPGNVYDILYNGNIYEAAYNTTNFRKYSISGGAWSTLTNLPETGTGASTMIHNGSEDEIYWLTGGNSNFRKYSILNNSWSSAASLPQASGTNTSNNLIRSDGENKMYWLAANNTTGFYAYNVYGYQTSGTYTSATLDLNATTLNSVSWNASIPSAAGANAFRVQIAANNDNSTWNYVGPSDDANQYFTSSGTAIAANSTLNGKRYYRYRVTFATASTTDSPRLNSLSLNYTQVKSVALTTVSSTFVDDGVVTAPNDDTGGVFGSGTASNTTVTGGASTTAYVSLANDSSFTQKWTQLASAPDTILAGSYMLQEPGEDVIYVLRGFQTKKFYKYTISTNTWSTLADVTGLPPELPYSGDLLMRKTGENYIYVFVGGYNVAYFKKYDISNNSWSALNAPSVAGGYQHDSSAIFNGSDEILLSSGGNATLHKYTISTNTWTQLVSPVYIRGLRRNGTDDTIYGLREGGTLEMYKYTISTNTVAQQQNLPSYNALEVLDKNSQAVFTNISPTENYLYVLRKNYTTPDNSRFVRYNSSNNTWTNLAIYPGSAGSGMWLFRNGTDDDLYAMSGNANTEFYKFSVSGNSWTALSNLPVNAPTDGSAHVLRSLNDNKIFWLVGNTTTNFYRFEVSGYKQLGTFTSATIDLGAKTLNSISWNATLPTAVGSTAVKFQIAANNDNATWNYVGSNDDPNQYFTTSGAIISASSILNGNRYYRYRAVLTTTDATITPILNDVSLAYTGYNTSGSLISSIYDSSDTANILNSIQWASTLPSNTTLQFQLRTAATSAGIASATWTGSDGTNGTYYTTAAGQNTAAALRDASNDRYFQYQVFLATTNTAVTPTLTSFTATYVVNAMPEVQTVTATANADKTVTISYQVRDSDTSTGTSTPGFITPSFQYCPNGTSCQAITTLAAGNTSNKTVEAVNWTTYTATWTPATDFANTYSAVAQVKVIANDNEAANNTGSALSASFTLDTKAPVPGSIVADASTTPVAITLNATDDSTFQMRLALSTSELAAATYAAYSASTTLAITTDPSTIYAQFKDLYGNESAAINVATPTALLGAMIQDISNVLVTPKDYRLFLAWKAASGSFASYKIYRSTDQLTWGTPLTTISSISTNYYTDTSVTADTKFYYYVVYTDVAGNTSFRSSFKSASNLSGVANGVQDAGEGGGGTAPPATGGGGTYVPPDTKISNVAASNISAAFATITWDTNNLADSEVGYSTSSGQFTLTTKVNSMVNNAASVGNHQVVLSGLKPDTTYYFKVSSLDINKKTVIDDNGVIGYTFKTLNGVEIQKVVVTDITNTTAKISWTTSAPANSSVYNSTSPLPDFSLPVIDGSLVIDHSVTLTKLSPGTRYYFYVKSTNANGVASEDKNVVAGVIKYYDFATTVDQFGPIISGLEVKPNITSADISWTTNEISDTQVEYGTTLSYTSATPLDSTLTITHNVTLGALLANREYHYRIKTTDANGNLTTSSDAVFSTLAAPDTTPPQISLVTVGGISLTTAVITWNTSERANHVVEYGLSTGYGSKTGDVGDFSSITHSVTLRGLSGNAPYYFRVHSQDVDGNTATDDNGGAGYSFTTVGDATPPIISNVTPKLNDTSVVIAWITNESANSRVDYSLTPKYELTAQTADFSLTHNVLIKNLTPNTLYYYKVTSADLSGNSATDDSGGKGYSFTTAKYPVATLSTIPQRIDNQRDLTGLEIKDIKISLITHNSALVSWQTDKSALGFVIYGQTSRYGLFQGNISSYLTEHKVNITDLSPSTQYRLLAVSVDQSGNLKKSDNLTFVTLNYDGSKAEKPIIKLDKPSLLQKPGQPDLDQPEEVDESLNQLIQDLPSPAITKVLTNLRNNPQIQDVSETIFVDAVNELANKIVDAPTIVGSSPQVEVTGNTAVINWTTDKKSSGIVFYAMKDEFKPEATKATEIYNHAAIDTSEQSTAHRITLTGLIPGTLYHFLIKSKAPLGPEYVGKDSTFITKSELPRITDLKLDKVATDNVTVIWRTNVPTITVLEYVNLKTGQRLNQGDALLLLDHSFTLKDLIPGAPYSLVIKATDELQNTVESAPTRFTTNIDVAPPIISKINSESTLYPGKNARVQSVITWETDEPSTSKVFYTTGIKKDSKPVELPLDQSLTTKHVVVVTQFKPGSVYRYWVESKDASGNKATSVMFSVLTPQEKETVVDVILKNFDQVFGWTKKLGL